MFLNLMFTSRVQFFKNSMRVDNVIADINDTITSKYKSIKLNLCCYRI